MSVSSSDPPDTTSTADAHGANQLWGGRFAAGPSAIMAEINVSIGFDKRLAAQDLAGSRAHAAMLAAQGIISADDEAAIQDGLRRIEAEIADGSFPFRDEYEDIHMNVEVRLRELIGEPAPYAPTVALEPCAAADDAAVASAPPPSPSCRVMP